MARCLQRIFGGLVIVATLLAYVSGQRPTPNSASHDRKPLPFTNVHFIANCPIGGDYWKQVRDAGLATTSEGFSLNHTYCLETPEEVKKVVDKIIASKPPPEWESTAVIIGTVGLPGEEYWARAVKAGLYVFLIVGVDLEKYGLDLSKQFLLKLEPNNERGGRLIGRELCRLAGSGYQNIALLKGKDSSLDVRLTTAITAFENACPSSKFNIAYQVRGNWSVENATSIFRSLFLVDPTITTVLSANDAMASGVFLAANYTLGATKARRLFISGFDDNEYIEGFLRRREIFASVNLGTTVPNENLWLTLPKIMSIIQDEGIKTTNELKAYLLLETNSITTDVVLAPADPEGYLLNEIDLDYMPSVRPLPENGDGATVVTVGIYDLRIEGIDTGEGSFTATFWLQLSWLDPRLKWNPVYYKGTLQRSSGLFWEPYVYVSNKISSKIESEIDKTPLTVTSDGIVKTALKMTSDFGCEMNVFPYPYDKHHCNISVTIGSDAGLVSLEPSINEDMVRDETDAFKVDPDNADIEAIQNNANPNGMMQKSVDFKLIFTRKPGFVHITYIMMGWGLNLASFAAFWISPEQGNIDRSGLGITTILSNFFLQYDARNSQITTWLDVFFIISTSFQFITFFVTVFTAHYAFDPDYKSENEIVQEEVEALRSLKSTFSYQDGNTSSRSAGGDGENEEMNYTFAEQVLRFCDSLLGDEKDFIPDRFGRRFVFPGFLVIMMVLPFMPPSGDNSPLEHEKAGVKSPLFYANFSMFLGWLAVVIIKVSFECAGFTAAGHNHEKRKAKVDEDRRIDLTLKHARNVYGVAGTSRKDFSVSKVVNGLLWSSRSSNNGGSPSTIGLTDVARPPSAPSLTPTASQAQNDNHTVI